MSRIGKGSAQVYEELPHDITVEVLEDADATGVHEVGLNKPELETWDLPNAAPICTCEKGVEPKHTR